MRKIILFLIGVIMCIVDIKAQAMKMQFGGNFSIAYDKNKIDYADGKKSPDIKQDMFQVVVKPKVYWYINEKMQFGASVGIGWGNLSTGLLYDKADEKQTINPDGTITREKPVIDKSIGWTFIPYYSYKLLQYKFVDIWLEGNLYVGEQYKINESHDFTSDYSWNQDLYYGFQILPVVDIALTEKLALQIHAGVISFGWSGEKLYYEDRTATLSSIDFHKGGITGLIDSICNFGIGMVHRF